MVVNLETLDIPPDELEIVREVVRRMAYQRWHDAGCPNCDGTQFWSDAEQEWIARYYIPRRIDLRPSESSGEDCGNDRASSCDDLNGDDWVDAPSCSEPVSQ